MNKQSIMTLENVLSPMKKALVMLYLQKLDASLSIRALSFQYCIFTRNIVSFMHIAKLAIINSKKMPKWTVISRSLAKKSAFDCRIVLISA